MPHAHIAFKVAAMSDPPKKVPPELAFSTGRHLGRKNSGSSRAVSCLFSIHKATRRPPEFGPEKASYMKAKARFGYFGKTQLAASQQSVSLPLPPQGQMSNCGGTRRTKCTIGGAGAGFERVACFG